jgi:hypothetical protein
LILRRFLTSIQEFEGTYLGCRVRVIPRPRIVRN